jgi:tetratricopeptide (TPR) repeat protein
LKSIASLSLPVIQKLARSYEKDSSSQDAKQSLALLFLRLGQYERAQKMIDEAIYEDPGNDELYLVQGIIALGGKKPFLCTRQIINLALKSANTAFSIREAASYKFFSAIVKYDYFHRKGFLIQPNFIEDLQEVNAIGLASGDKDELLKVVRFDVTAEFLAILKE